MGTFVLVPDPVSAFSLRAINWSRREAAATMIVSTAGIAVVKPVAKLGQQGLITEAWGMLVEDAVGAETQGVLPVMGIVLDAGALVANLGAAAPGRWVSGA